MYVSIVAFTLFFIAFFSGDVIASTTGPTGPKTGSKYKLKYFDARGAAEVSRLIFKIGGVDFLDYRYPITAKEGGGFETLEFNTEKEAGSFAVNMGRVPILEIDGGEANVGQSRAIERYVANKCGLLGETDEERFFIDCVVENVRDIKDKWGKIRMAGGFGPNAEKELAMEKWFKGGELEEWLVKLEKSLPAKGSNYWGADDIAVGRKLSYADISIWHLLRDYFTDPDAAKMAEKKSGCARLTKIAEKVAQMSVVKEWLSARPPNPF